MYIYIYKYIYMYIYIYIKISLTNVHYFNNDVTVFTDSVRNGNYINFIVICLFKYCFIIIVLI